jgi:DNA repair exonuclease SbcCD ATPase subunit
VSDKIKLVKSLRLTNIRGFTGEDIQVNTDADIVFLSGPNGMGKTSLIDALCLALTGYHYIEREPLISVNKKEGSVIANVIMYSGREVVVSASLSRRSSSRTDVLWSGEGLLQKRNDMKALHARASIYYQDILKYLFEEESESDVVYLEDFLLASDIPVTKIHQACKNGLYIVNKFEESIYPKSATESLEEIERNCCEIASKWEEEMELAANEIAQVLSDYGFEGKAPSRTLTTKQNALRENWKTLLVGLIREYNNYLKIDFAHELKSDLQTVIVLEYLKTIFEKLLNQYRVRLQEKLSSQQKIEAFFTTGYNYEIALNKSAIDKMELEQKQVETDLEELKKKQTLVEKLLKHFESRSIDGQNLHQVLVEMRQSGPGWLEIEEELAKEVPKAVLNWLQKSVNALDSIEPAVDKQMEEWLQKQTDMRTSLGEEISKLEVRRKHLDYSINKSKEFQRILKDFPELLEKIPKDEGETIHIEMLANKLGREVKASVEGGETFLNNLISIASNWLLLERKREELEKLKTSSKIYQAIKDDLDGLKKILTTEGESKTSITSTLHLMITPEKRKSLAKQINDILERLHPGQKIPTVELKTKKGKKAWIIETADKRTLSCFSTGQKSLLGIASLVALNIALQPILWADVLAFDDFTSSLDLNQIPRLASLLRQIAYGSGISNNASSQIYKRQVFLVSHHEDLTNKLLDFLIPPPGHTMRVINFTGWSPDSGPKFEEIDVVQCSSSAHDVKKGFASLLAEELTRFYERVR